jgi:hypothetical protein
MDIFNKIASEFGKFRSNSIDSGQGEPKFTTQIMNDQWVRICTSVRLPDEKEKREFFCEVSTSKLDDLPHAYFSLFELINVAWDKSLSRTKDS